MRPNLRLFFLRHGEAEPQRGGMDDADRALTQDGRRLLRCQAEALARLEPGIDAVIHSPLLRAEQTASIFARELEPSLGCAPERRLAPGCRMEDLEAVLDGAGADARRVLLVGHQPDFGWLVGELCGGAEVEMRTGALARVDFDGRGALPGRLVWLLQPWVMAAGEAPEEPA